MKPIVPVELIENKILLIHGQKVMLDADLAEIYGVVTNCDHLAKLKFSKALPHAFTEHGALMATSVLNSEKAVETSVFVIRAFVRLRGMISSHKALAEKLNELEKRLEGHDTSITEIVKVIQYLMQPDGPLKKKKIGFIQNEE